MINNTLNSPQTKAKQVAALDSFKSKFLTGQNKTPFQPIAQNKTSVQTTQQKPQTGLVSNQPKPTTQSTSSGIGAYKGVSINPGTQEQIQAQMKSIDNPIQQSKPSTLSINTQSSIQPPKPVTTPTQTRVKGLFPNIVSSLAERGTKSSEAVERAQKEYAQASENLRKFKESVSDTSAGIKSDPVSARVMQGREAALQQANAEKLSAYQEAVGQAQTGVELGQAQQSLEQQALQQAGSLASPVQAPYSSALYDPTSGQMVTQGGLGGYAGFNAAEQVQSLISQYPDAGYIYRPELTPQQNLQNAQSAIQDSPTYQRTTFGAPGASSFLGGAGLQTAGKLQEDRANLQSQVSSAEANFELMLNLAREAGINNTNVPILNTLQQAADRGLISNESVVSFRSMIQSVRSQYATVLAGGGVPTDTVRNEAKDLVPDDVSVSALETLAGNLKSEAGNRLAGLSGQIQSLSGTPSGQQNGVIRWEDL